MNSSSSSNDPTQTHGLAHGAVGLTTADRNLAVCVAYDGTDFHGLAPNDGVRTVVGEISRVLADVFGIATEVVMSGRTDAGVHGWGQILSFWIAQQVSCEQVMSVLNSRLHPEISVRWVKEVADDFSARFTAKGRTYKYRIATTDYLDPFQARFWWWHPKQLDFESMERAATHFVGTHDFSAFCRRPKPRPESEKPSLVRTVTAASWAETNAGEGIEFQISGSAFCHQMVRSIVGFCVAVGVHRRKAAEIPAVLGSGDRANGEQLAPPHGLTLWEVEYPEGSFR